MKKTALVIMAAGIGSRFGKGIKQLAPVGPNGEIIMDYSIHDALEAGFNKVVFIIRKDIEEEFRSVIGNRIEKITEVAYAFQALEDLPEGFSAPAERTKPWGTGQAVLAAKKVLDEPFAVINADDYYGKAAYRIVHDYLVQEQPQDDLLHICMAGFRLGNTLSDNGSVTRGICHVEDGGNFGVFGICRILEYRCKESLVLFSVCSKRSEGEIDLNGNGCVRKLSLFFIRNIAALCEAYCTVCEIFRSVPVLFCFKTYAYALSCRRFSCYGRSNGAVKCQKEILREHIVNACKLCGILNAVYCLTV